VVHPSSDVIARKLFDVRRVISPALPSFSLSNHRPQGENGVFTTDLLIGLYLLANGASVATLAVASVFMITTD
jgi:hypothetical protein